MSSRRKLGMLLGGMFFTLSANAAVTGYTSGVENIPDLSGGYDVTHPGTENDKVVVFQEKYSFQLDSDLVTDSGTIGAGTYIGSYLVNYSPVGTGPRSSGLQEISFSDEILGVIYTTSGLNATDGLLGHDNVSYPTGTYNWRGLEGGADTVTFVDATVAQILNTVNNGVDQMRVITAAPVPLPAAVWMFGAGLLGLVGFARRSAKKAAVV